MINQEPGITPHEENEPLPVPKVVTDESLRQAASERTTLDAEREKVIATMNALVEKLGFDPDIKVHFACQPDDYRHYVPEKLTFNCTVFADDEQRADFITDLKKIIHYLDLPIFDDTIDQLNVDQQERAIATLQDPQRGNLPLGKLITDLPGTHRVRRALRKYFIREITDQNFPLLQENKRRNNQMSTLVFNSYSLITFSLEAELKKRDANAPHQVAAEAAFARLQQLLPNEIAEMVATEYNEVDQQDDPEQIAKDKEAFLQKVTTAAAETLRLTAEILHLLTPPQDT